MLFDYGLLSDALSGVLVVYGVLLLFFSCIGIVTYIFQSIGLYKMAKNLNLSHAWMAWVPILSTYTLGKIGSKYVKNDGNPSAKFGGWLLGLEISLFAVVIGMIASLIGIIPNLIAYGALDSTTLPTGVVSSFATIFGFWFVLCAVSIAYSVVYYVALWRVFAIFDNSTATVFLIVSILFSIATPFLLFAVRNKRPAITFADRTGFVPPVAEPIHETQYEAQPEAQSETQSEAQDINE